MKTIKSTKKQPAKKRPYKKRTNLTKIKNNDLSELATPIKVTNKDTEVESLALICSIFDNWNHEQKQRNLKYLCGRYYDFM